MSQDLIIKSPCGTYQYVEHIPIEGGEKGACMVLGLSPLTHPEGKLDKASENCVEYAKRNGYSAVILVNLYAAVNIDPTLLPRLPKTIGEENNQWIAKAAEDSEFIIGAWGDFPRIKNRVYEVLKLLDGYDIYAIQTNRNGSPSHPLAWKKKAAKLYRRARPGSGQAAS